MNIATYRAFLKADLRANRGNSKGLFVVSAYRTAAYLHDLRRRRPVLGLVGLPLVAGYKFFFDYVMGIYIPPETRIGQGLAVYHGVGLVVHPASVIGDNCTLRHGVTIGTRDGSADTVPVIGSNVSVGPLAVIIGKIMVGDDAQIGAGAVVLRDVPPGTIAVGNPASIKTPRSR